MKIKKVTAVICYGFDHFLKWAKQRRIRRFNSNSYIDYQGELYYPIYNSNHALSLYFEDVEMADGCNDLNLFNECMLRVKSV